MKLLTERKHLTVVAALLAGAGLWAIASAMHPLVELSPPDVSSLWSWSFRSWDSVRRGADGAVVRTVYEPVALFRNFALIALAITGVAWGGRRLLSPLRASILGGTELSAAEIEAAGRQLAAELQGLVHLAQTHSQQNQAYSAALNSGQSSLAASRGSDQIRAAIQFLIGANKRMLRSNEEYESRLRESQAQIQSLRAALAETQELTSRDSLTNAYSRRHFDETLARLVRKAGASRQALSLIIADIDHFKDVNDTFGHPVGDDVLRKVCDLLIANTKGADSVARYGGEEFAIILPDTAVGAAAQLAEQIRRKLAAKRWVVKDGAAVGAITASFGVAELDVGESAEDLVRRADAKLYVSKAAGRNLVSD